MFQWSKLSTCMWWEAMKEELQALQNNHTWDVGKLLEGKKPLGCRWIYKIIYNKDGISERYKARLVAKCFTQINGIDYKKIIFSYG